MIDGVSDWACISPNALCKGTPAAFGPKTGLKREARSAYATGRRREWNGVDTHAASFTRRSSRLSAAAALTVLGLGLAGMAGRRWRQRKA